MQRLSRYMCPPSDVCSLTSDCGVTTGRCHCALRTIPKRNGDRKGVSALRHDLASQRKVTWPGCAEFPVHLEMCHQILPPVAGTDIPNGSSRKPSAASHDQVHTLVLGMEQVVPADFRTPTGVARALARKVRSQQRIEPQLAAQ